MIYHSKVMLRGVVREAFGNNLIGYEGSRGSRCGKVYLKKDPKRQSY